MVCMPRFCCARMRSSSRLGPWLSATRQEAELVRRVEALTSLTRLAERGLDHRDGGGFIDGRLVLLRVVGRVDARDQVEVEIALAQRLQRLALELRWHRGPEGVDGIGQQQHLDAARGRSLQPRIGLQPLDAVTDEVIDLGLVRLEIGDDLLERAPSRPTSW